ncbi:hypothetical protein L0Y65_03890 [Candidatus Micrarchaeota archaeon]|nr:hypothetical protein [Candidatus Micrarchaeota archaeon]
MRRKGSSETISPQDVSGKILGYMEERFGLGPELFSPYRMYLASKGRVYLGPRNVPDMPKIATIGLLIARVNGAVKPSTNLLQIMGKHVEKNAVELEKQQALDFAKGQDVRLAPAQLATLRDGYVLMRYNAEPLGCGFLRLGAVKNMLPKAKRLPLRFI